MRGVGSREEGRGGGQCSDTERSPAGPETLKEGINAKNVV